MFTHVMIGTNNAEAATRFYDAVLGALNIRGQKMGDRAFYRHDGMAFGVGSPANGEPATFANGGTIGFKAASKEEVDAFHKAGLEAGGTCDGPPGKRPKAPGNAYGAYLRDPDGNKICSFCQLPPDA